MFYKVMKNGKVIDVLDHLSFVKYQEKHDVMLLCEESEAQAIMSSDGEYFWHLKWLLPLSVKGYDTVELVEIDEFEYKQLRMLNLKNSTEIIDEYTMMLIEGGIL